ncbi:MAG: SPOR domain-containing protein [Paracoccus sp. (in: a-proteobacteria)]|nr:SPOR domain-containing protein [Paracoccus sp. (in: a-proteobacteria)]
MAQFLNALAVIWLFLAAGAALATPAEPPPDDFSALQYVDSEGCVARRDPAGEWARMQSEGAPVCGFPPSFGAPERGALLRAEPAAPRSAGVIERELMMAVASEVELVDGPASAPPAQTGDQRQPAPSPASSNAAPAASTPAARAEQLGAAIARELAAPAPRVHAAPLGQSSQLCAALGMATADAASPVRPDDPTRGLCAPARAASDLAAQRRVSAAPLPAAAPAPEAEQPGDNAGAAEPRARAEPSAAQPDRARGPQTAAPRSRPAAPTRTAAPPEPRNPAELVPANARFVQIGQFTREDAAERAVTALRALGYPPMRARRAGDDSPHIILAGPFASRERLIHALDHLRAAGYPTAVAR